MPTKNLLPLIGSILCVAVGVACGGGEVGAGGAGPAASSQVAAASGQAGVGSFTAADLDGYAKGMTREIEAVRAAEKEAAAATDAAARGRAAQKTWDTETIPLGAEAAGVPVERYRAVREAVNEVFKTLSFQRKIDGPMRIDLSRVDDATKARIGRDPFTDLTPEAAAALRGAMDRLVPIWIEYVRLTAVAG
jgi:hypothetical protein